MTKLKILFTNPWFLLLLIPAIALTLIPYFRTVKRYRRNRNRITSMVLHTIVMLLAITVLAGIGFEFIKPNYDNELILLVDMSDTEELSAERRDEFVKTVLEFSKEDNVTVGVVTFGFTQVNAVPLTTDADSVYEKYLKAPKPDVSATDIAAALRYAKGLFEHPDTGKILLITDGKETDQQASSAIREVLAQGTKLDTAWIPSEFDGTDIQITDIKFPEYHVDAGTECDIEITLRSTELASCVLKLYDNDVLSPAGEIRLDLTEGSRTVTVRHSFANDGLHVIRAEATDTSDEDFEQNNTYASYYNIETFNKILILERFEGTSEPLRNMLIQNDRYNVEKNGDTIHILNLINDPVPTTMEQLIVYDQIIMNNVSNADLEEHTGLVDLLYSYVYDYGGGMFTVGGNDDLGEIHAYDRKDMFGSKYQEMLPVQAIDYTPPVGVVVIVDVSGSMTSTLPDGNKGYEWAIAGAKSCLNALTERDYFGIMTMSDSYTTALGLSSCAFKEDIIEAIDNHSFNSGGTKGCPAYRRAVLALESLKNVEKRHIILLTDYMLNDRTDFEALVNTYYGSNKVTLSIVGIGMTGDYVGYAENAAVNLGHGRLIELDSGNLNEITTLMRDDLTASDIKDVIPEDFNPTVSNTMSSLVYGIETGTDEMHGKLTVTLGGFYGTKKRPAAEMILSNDYEVPLYAQWKFGKGTVGSFMSDLNGTWSADFMADQNGQKLICNIIANLMPIENIRNTSENFVLTEDNYTNQLSVYSVLTQGQYIDGKVYAVSNTGAEELIFGLNQLPNEGTDLSLLNGYTTLALGPANNYSRCGFVLKDPGIYKILLTTCNADGSKVAETVLYKSLSYSEEYSFVTPDPVPDYADELDSLAQKGGGALVADNEAPVEVFEGFVTELTNSFDPRYLFMILAIVLMLTDIAVRKFKFKWPHELIRDWKNKKAEQKNAVK